MSIKIEGFDKIKKHFKDLENKAKAIEGEHRVSWDVLFNEDFIQENTQYQSMQELLDNSGFQIESEEDFKKIPDNEWDDYIQKVTDFESWEDMMGSASQEYVAKQLGF